MPRLRYRSRSSIVASATSAAPCLAIRQHSSAYVSILLGLQVPPSISRSISVLHARMFTVYIACRPGVQCIALVCVQYGRAGLPTLDYVSSIRARPRESTGEWPSIKLKVSWLTKFWDAYPLLLQPELPFGSFLSVRSTRF